MIPFPATVTDAELIAYVDRWAELLERRDYPAAFALTDQNPHMGWTPEHIRQAIEDYGDAAPDQRVTLHGEPTDLTQRKEVERWPVNPHGCFGEIWYDLNIDGVVSDLTATFNLMRGDGGGVAVQLNDIHVM